MAIQKVPEISVSRLSLYLRTLKEFSKRGRNTISSQELAKEIGENPHKIRKDLCYFGQFGKRGVGYFAQDLISCITKILGLSREWRIALCGAGNLGSALFNYKGFKEQGLNIVAIFDNDPKKIGKVWQGVKILSAKDINSKLIKSKGIDIAIIAVPASIAQEVADKLIKVGIKAILNFAPVKLIIPKNVKLRNVDLSTELINLTHFLT